MQKIYERINWENDPSKKTPINEDNLNRMDYTLDVIDDRVVALSGYEERARQSEINAKESEENAKESELLAEQYKDYVFSSTPEGFQQLVEDVENIKVGHDGTVYDTAAEAVQTQIGQLSSEIENVESELKETLVNKLGIKMLSDYSENDKFTTYASYGELFRENSFIDNDGSITELANIAIYKLPKFNGFFKISEVISGWTYGVIKRGEVYTQIIYTSSAFYSIDEDCEVYLNVRMLNSQEVKVDLIGRSNTNDLAEVNLLNYECHKGIVNANGTISDSDNSLYAKVDISLLKNHYLYFDARTNIGLLYNSNDVLKGILKSGYNDISLFSYALINIDSTYHKTKVVNKEKEVLFDKVQKMGVSDFTGKNIFFFGDSITYGDGATSQDNGFPKKFSDLCGANCFNYGVSGSTYSYYGKTEKGISPVYEKMMTTNLDNADFAIFAGGTNDFGYGAPLGDFDSVDANDFTGSVREIITYMKTNYPSKKMIFITPINRVRINENAVNIPLHEYTKRIVELCNIYDVDYVIGENMPFESTETDYAHAIFYDLLHPNDLGYTIYSKYLFDKIVY